MQHDSDADQQMAARLVGSNPDLPLPSSMYKTGNPSEADVQTYLVKLASSQPSVFLERYGRYLNFDERGLFASMRDDYEVNFWLTQLEAATPLKGTHNHRLPASVKNRRLAHMQQLVEEGDFFSMENMRKRAPLLYHEYLGQYEADATIHVPTGGALSESLLHQHDEALHHVQLQQDLEIQHMQESESESSSDDEEIPDAQPEPTKAQPQVPQPRVQPGVQPGGQQGGQPGESSLSDIPVPQEDLGTRQAQFLDEMQSLFLSGKDAQHVNYQEIDANAHLDDYWLDERARDAEEKYFDED